MFFTHLLQTKLARGFVKCDGIRTWTVKEPLNFCMPGADSNEVITEPLD
jgi:hypothetical protein